jgi:P-type E1-E2 ATPase
VPRPSGSAARGIVVDVPGDATLVLRHLVLDFNGTLACDGKPTPGVRSRLRALARRLDVHVLTADTFGTARAALRDVPVHVDIVRTGTDKRRFVASRGHVVAVGNGRNDVAMMRAAALGIAVLGPEGSSAELLRAVDVVARDVGDALDLLLYPKRLIATLRP